MLVNMPTTTTTTIGTHPLPTMESGAQGQSVNFNYLKRKLDVDEQQQQQQPQQQQQSINNETGGTNGVYRQDGSGWKKRHLEEQQPLGASSVRKADCYNNNNTSSTNNNNNNNNLNDGNHNNNIDNSNDLQFSLINNAFINDLFNYDSPLVVPVASISLVSQTSTAVEGNNTAVATFATPSNVAIDGQFVDDGSHWQASDLLELDHRYNSALQSGEVEEEVVATPTIAQLNPTVVVNQQQHGEQQQQQQQQQHPQSIQNHNHQHHQQQQPPQSIQNHNHQHQQQQPTNFLVPLKQVSRSQHTLSKYRQHQQQQQQQHSQSHQNNSHQYASQQQNDSESDFEDKNLSWLLNFKFDELPHLSPDIGNSSRPALESTTSLHPSTTHSNSSSSSTSSPSSVQSPGERARSKSPKSSSKVSKKFEELVMEVTAECDGNDMVVGENVVVEDYSPKTQKKPPFTYTELIEYALEDKGELTVSGIYQWISDRFPFYKSNDDRWKNSVRHNLSINPHFRKGAKAPQGAGHLWTISSGDSAENVLAWEHKKQRLDLFFKMESMNRERIQEHQQKMQKQQQQQQQLMNQQQHQQQQQQQQTQQQQPCSEHSSLHQSCQPDQCVYDEAAAAAAAITQEMLQQTSPSPHASSSNTCGSNGREQRSHCGFHELPFNDLMSDEELRKTAGQILNGIHREVEVQSVNSIISTYHDVLLDSDYLNPIHKDVAVNESGLRNTSCHSSHSSQYYITEIDPIELGIQMSHQVEEEVLFSDEFNLNYFGYNASNDIVA